MKNHLFAFAALLIMSTPSWAGDSDIDLDAITNQQSFFKDLSREVGLTIAYKQMAPAEPLGILGFDIGVEVTAIDIDDDEPYWELTTDDIPSMIPVPKLRATVGLPLGIDVGGLYASVPASDITLTGAEVKWSFIKGGIALPALALRGAYTELDGIDDLDLETTSLDLSISKGFAMLTPYAGVGKVWIESDPTKASLLLDKEDFSESRSFVGLRISMALLKLVAEAEFAEVNSYSLKLSLGF